MELVYSYLCVPCNIMRMDDNADAKSILLASPPADWRRQLGRPRITWLNTVQQDLKQHHLTLPEAADLAQNRPLWRIRNRELHARNDDDAVYCTVVSCGDITVLLCAVVSCGALGNLSDAMTLMNEVPKLMKMKNNQLEEFCTYRVIISSVLNLVQIFL